MKLPHLTLVFFILLSPFSYAKGNILDDQDKQSVHRIVKSLTDKIFLLETTQYTSKKLQKELLVMMPDKISADGEEEPLTKKKYIYDSIRLAKNRKATDDKIIRDNVVPICRYIEDGTIDCDLKEHLKCTEKNDKIPQKPIEYETGTEYKFNLKMSETGDWYINKMKTWNVIPAPRMSTLGIEKNYRKKLKSRRKKLNSFDRAEDDNIYRPTRPPENAFNTFYRKKKKTDVELAEEEADKEEQERLFQQLQERIKNQTNDSKIRVDRNGNIIHSNANKLFNGRKKILRSRKIRSHPFYGDGWSWNRGKLWKPSYAVSYALEYALNYNPNYRRYSYDCTNFVSQVLVNGGWQNDIGWYSSDHAWWYNTFSQSHSWGGARNLQRYLIYQEEEGNVEYKRYWWKDLVPGDVLALTRSNYENFAAHMMIVTAVHNDEFYVSGHTTNRRNEAWSKIDPHNNYWGWGYHILHGNLR